ncbi:MAG TPA: sensor histidine kinase KdpD [Bacteroidales bacterium]|nr:sensor histidine kinase KdpD [Bacteroidales bacterium]
MVPEELRPDPDELLAQIKEEEDRNKRGKLKIFFGMCAGVGKTYTMLQAAHAEKFKGLDIVIGYIETHKRKETEELLDGFEQIPRKLYTYKDATLEEMDTDSIIARSPQIAIVDELAHSNAPGSRHSKRFQDVQELLESGISVYTTLNVQHLESRSDTVAQITGIIVRETLPDEVFENADEVELVDLTPDELIQRLNEGKVYTYERSKEAITNFFRKGNITALREMALRLVADRVDKQLHDYMHEKRIRGPWKSRMSLLVAVDFNIQSTRLLRWAKNLSYSMGAGIQAVYVETSHQLTDKEREQLDKNINLARQLGINFRIITNYDRVKAIVDFSIKENITHIIVGKPRVRNVYSMFRLGSFVNKLIKYSGNIDVYILGSDRASKDKFKDRLTLPAFTPSVNQYFITLAIVITASAICYLVKDFLGYQVVSFILLFLVSLLAVFYGVGPILLAATLSAAIWDFLFIPPPFTLHIDKPVDVLMLIMFFIIALLNGILTSRVRLQEKKVRIREERTHALYQLTRELGSATGIDEVLNIAVQSIQSYFKLDCIILLKDEFNQLSSGSLNPGEVSLTENDKTIASWVFKHSLVAGKFTDTLPSTEFTFYPLRGTSGIIGVIAIKLHVAFTQGEKLFWEGVISQISGKFEREFLREAAKKAFVLNESDKLYKTLFSSISHELRIPVATILGASDELLTDTYPRETQIKLLNEINTASLRLNRLIENLLNMSRLESGRITVRLDWCDVHDLAVKVTSSLKKELSNYHFYVVIPENTPLVYIDFGLIEQVLYNLILNSIQNSPPDTNIRLKFFYDNGYLTIQVMDRGNGFLNDDVQSLFDKFYRGKNAKAGGTGLGLSIVKGFVEAHNGTVKASNRQNGGAVFTIVMPVKASELTLNEKGE